MELFTIMDFFGNEIEIDKENLITGFPSQLSLYSPPQVDRNITLLFSCQDTETPAGPLPMFTATPPTSLVTGVGGQARALVFDSHDLIKFIHFIINKH